MSDETKRDKILDKIAKAIALAESEKQLGHLEAAENAASIASRMMLEHGISNESVAARQNGTDKISYSNYVPTVFDDAKYIRETPWMSKLASVVAQAFNCRILIPHIDMQREFGFNTFTFVGYKVESVQAVYYYHVLSVALAEAVDKEYRRAFHRAYRNGTHASMSGVNWRKNFLIGAIAGLVQRFQAIRNEVISKAPDQSTALVRLNQALVAIDKELSHFDHAPQKNILEKDELNRNALQAGKKWADEVPLLAPLEQTKAEHVLPNN